MTRRRNLPPEQQAAKRKADQRAWIRLNREELRLSRLLREAVNSWDKVLKLREEEKHRLRVKL